MPIHASYPAGKATANTITPAANSIAQELLNSVQQLRYRAERIAFAHNNAQTQVALLEAKIAEVRALIPVHAVELGKALTEHAAAEIFANKAIADNPSFLETV